ncbi:hypothetical protein TB2_045446 [Malus domestica]
MIRKFQRTPPNLLTLCTKELLPSQPPEEEPVAQPASIERFILNQPSPTENLESNSRHQIAKSNSWPALCTTVALEVPRILFEQKFVIMDDEKKFVETKPDAVALVPRSRHH